MGSGEVVVLGGARTAFGAYGGSLRGVSAIDLGATAARAALERAGVPAEEVDNVVFGNVLQTSTDALYLARHVALKAGIPIEVPALTVNRLCGSGLQAVVTAAQSILLGESRLALAGGTENMSQAPHAVYGARWGLPLGQATPFVDTLWAALLDTYAGCTMAHTAEHLAKDYKITREECDAYALRSHRRAAQARASGRLAHEIVPVTVPHPRQPTVVQQDEHIRADASMEALRALPPRFVADGVVTAGNASGINDGAAAVVVCDGAEARRRGWRPLGRIVAWAVVGVEPARMGIGPAPAIRRALERAELRLGEVDLVEVNEAFAAQYLAVEKELGLDRERTNVNGGAIALGHPLGASGARLLLTLLLELRARGGRYGVAGLCIGGGQGIAVVVQAL